ncbi:hypothetical protein EVAR_49301_1 [Eumeta japonica]|uniref:Uncharacterized protein n=1 Tax=Eumeta variegata TaxID=151549 RepID=A0A4C1XNB8_EUMVA|nr:hypothetical protein EVAR_49301_1 [Eumeta japonica]
MSCLSNVSCTPTTKYAACTLLHASCDSVINRGIKVNVSKTKVMVFEKGESTTDYDIYRRNIERRVNAGNKVNWALLAVVFRKKTEFLKLKTVTGVYGICRDVGGGVKIDRDRKPDGGSYRPFDLPGPTVITSVGPGREASLESVSFFVLSLPKLRWLNGGELVGFNCPLSTQDFQGFGCSTVAWVRGFMRWHMKRSPAVTPSACRYILNLNLNILSMLKLI